MKLLMYSQFERAQYFSDITEKWMNLSRPMSFLEEQKQDPVLYNSHRAEREVLSGNIAVEVSSRLVKARIEKSKNGCGGGRAAQQE